MRPRLAAVLALLCAGCASAPAYRAPATPAAAAAPFSAADAPVLQQPLPDAWWRLYRDPALDALIAQALDQNRDLAVARAHLLRAQALTDAAEAARLPDTQAAFGGNEGKQAADQIVAAAQRGASADTRWAWTPSFAVSYEVDLWGRVRHLIDAAHADAAATQAATDAVRVSVVAETTGSYAQACAYGERIEVAQQSLAIAQHVADLTAKQRDHGLISDLEVARAQGFVETSRAGLPALEGQRRAALAQLAVLIGQPPSEVPEAAARCHVAPVLAQPFPVGDGAALLRRRPDLREAERRLAAANARVGVATAALYPSIVLGGSVDLLSTSGSLASLGDRYAMAWGIGPLISWRFPNRALSVAALAQARADNGAALASFDGHVLNALKETEQALAFYGTQWTRHRALQAALEQDDRALDLAQLNYRAGALDFLDVLDAERSLVAARAALAESSAALSADQIAVFKALGGGWQSAATAAENNASKPSSPTTLSSARP
ncbi:efflux transporter outer membrane subunit [Paraburkholderia sp. BCC1886]|uniref:efflux transporter outer membrane subunit n=1 Tax=Paraburkholderia sp. BCC1886 TaxID=2562670 RepID=UPI0021B20BE9|nr:efflux transporter outer membrane subunit [Paraburkholderia sp. BCC1886]